MSTLAGYLPDPGSFLTCFPPRTVSVNDIVAETIGAAIGIVAWFLVGARFHDWLSLREANQTKGRVAETADRFLKIHLCLLFFYALMPLDLTLSVAEVTGHEI